MPSNVSKTNWLQGLITLGQLWKRGLLPKDLERHYFLHWFVIYKGNIIQTAKALKIHRNTIQGHFLKLGYSKKSVSLRHSWQKLVNQAGPFEKIFPQFYNRLGGKPRFSDKENIALVKLWQTKFPFKTLTPHFLLWSIRNGNPRRWVEKKLGYSSRHRARLLNQIIKTNTRDGLWLSPLKPQLKEIYSRRYQTMLSAKKKR